MVHIKRIDEMANVNKGNIKDSLENFMLFEMKWYVNGVKKTQYGLFIKKGTLHTPDKFGDSLAVTQCRPFVGDFFDMDEFDDNLHYMYSDKTTDMYVSRIWYPIESLKNKYMHYPKLSSVDVRKALKGDYEYDEDFNSTLVMPKIFWENPLYK